MVSFDVPVTGQKINTNRGAVRGVGLPIALGAAGVAFLLLIWQLGQMAFESAGEVLPGSIGGGPGSITIKGAE